MHPPLQLQFVGGAGLASGAIEWFSAGPLSHVDAVWGTGYLLGSRSDVKGSMPPGVQIRPSYYITAIQPRLVVQVETTEQQYGEWSAFLLSQLQKPYDKPGIWGFAFGRDWREEDSWFCSELQMAALEAAGISGKVASVSNKITPVGLANIVTSWGKSAVVDAWGLSAFGIPDVSGAH